MFDVDGADSESESGFHLGVFTLFIEKIGLQLKVTYSSVEDFSMISIRNFKYHLSEDFNSIRTKNWFCWW